MRPESTVNLRPRARSLATKILATVLFGVSVPSLLGGWYLLRRHHELLAEKLQENVANHLFRRANEVDDWRAERLREVQRWSGSFVVVESVDTLTRGRGDAASARRDLAAYVESVLGHYRGYESLFVVDPAGRVLASTREERLDPVEIEILDSGAAGGQGRVSPIRRSEFLGRPSLVVVHPVESAGGGGRTIGFFVERPDLRELEEILATLPSDPLPAFWLIDGAGRVVIRQGWVEPEPGVSSFPGALPAPDAESGPVREATFPGLGEVVYGTRRLKVGGFLAATVPAAAAYRSLDESRNRLLSFGLAGLAVVLLVSLLVARGIVQPIRLLSEGARRMSAGDMDVTLPVRGQDELAELTRSFNEMSAQVRAGHENAGSARDHRRAHGPVQPPPLRGRADSRDAAGRAGEGPALAGDDRPRSLQGVQRPLGTPGGGRRAGPGRAAGAAGGARDRRGLPLRRGRAGGPAAGVPPRGGRGGGGEDPFRHRHGRGSSRRARDHRLARSCHRPGRRRLTARAGRRRRPCSLRGEGPRP